MRRLIIAGLLIIGFTGCSRIPFQKVTYVPLIDVQPAAVREQFAASLPQKFQLVNTIVFQYNRFKISAIGYTDIDAYEKKFTIVSLNPLGIKLFELSGNAADVKCTFALEEFTRHSNFIQMVADDIRKIYFERIPSPEARVYKKPYKIIFRQSAGKNTTEYIFAGADNQLIEKRYYQGKQLIWAVFYYEYLKKNGRIYPAGIIFKHNQYGYQLVVRLKEIRG